MDNEKQTLVKSDNSDNSDNSEVKKNRFCNRRNISIIVILILIFVLVLVLTILNYSVEGGISASSKYYRYTCSATDYGCCEIYTQCKSEEDSVDYKIDKIMDGIVAHDSAKSNCPTLETLINRYNDHYGSEDCGEYGLFF